MTAPAKSSRFWAPAVLLALIIAGCGGDLEGEEIGCPWFAAADNCWKASLRATSSCLPPASEVGTLSADGRSCQYQSGASITFHRPVNLAHLDTQLWDFELRQGEQLCLGFSEPSEEKRLLTTSLGVYIEEVKNLGLQLTCPDGAKYKVINVTYLLSCTDYEKNLPGISTAWNEKEVAFSFAGTGSSPLRIFTCRQGG